ncbi:MAG: hypothetical protein GY855_16680 [candidate division Zixibacteria bacterium]|nr:hypothetical protein [candidate division Zixibacteria bacterium]
MELIYNTEAINAEINKAGDGYRLSGGNGDLVFNIQDLSPGIYSIILGGKSVKAFVARNHENIFVNINGETFEFNLPKDDSETRGDNGSVSGDDAYRVLPPMPSKVVKVLVEKGQNVAKGEGLVVLESMKMENLVKSTVDAVVEEVNFKDGDLVDTGQVVIQLAAVEE